MRQSWASAISVALICTLLVNACGAPVRPLQRQHVEQARLKKQSVVLLRLAGDAEGAPIDLLSYWTTTDTGGSKLELTALDAVPSPRRYPVPIALLAGHLIGGAPSKEARRQGWYYFVLDPGAYHLHLVPPFRQDQVSLNGYTGKWTRGTAPEDPTFWFNVSGTEPALYVGTLQVSCTIRHDFGHWGYIDQCSEIRLVDETESASAVSGLQPITTALMREYGTGLADRRIDRLLPARLVATGTHILGSPSWVTRGMVRAVTFGLDGGVRDSREPRPEPGSTRESPGLLGAAVAGAAWGLAPLFLMLIVAYEAIALPTGAIAGSMSARKWQPCVDRLAEAMRSFDVTTQWEVRLGRPTATIANPVQVDPVGAKSFLQVDMLRVELRECRERWTFCVEVAIHARLWDTATNALLFNEILRFSSPAARATPSEQVAYEIPLSVDAPCHKIEAYCDAQGPRLIQEEIGHAIEAAAEHVRHDLGFDLAVGDQGQTQ